MVVDAGRTPAIEARIVGMTNSPKRLGLARCVFVLACLPLVAACVEPGRESSTLVSARIEWAADGKAVARSLSPEQVGRLSGWLSQSVEGWHRCFETPSPIRVWTLSLQYADGSSGWLSLLKYRDQPTPSTIEASHVSGSALADQPCTLQSLGPASLEALAATLPH